MQRGIMITITYSVVQKKFVYTLVDKCLKQSLKVLSIHICISQIWHTNTLASKFQGLEYLLSKD